MKIQIDSFEVELKVKRTYEKRCNKLSTMYFINWLEGLLFDSARLDGKIYEDTSKECYKNVSEQKYDMGRQLYELLNEMHFYDDVK